MKKSNDIYNIDVKKVLQDLDLKARVVGDNYQLPCPNPLHHDSKTDGGSFYVHSKDLVFNCFGCDWQGSIFTLIMLLLDISFDEAIDWLKNSSNFDFNSKEFVKKEILKRIAVEISETKNPFILPKLQEINSARIFSFFDKRHISKEIALKYGAKVCLEGFYKNRIIFPILEKGNLRGFEARIIHPSLGEPKCLYPPSSSIKQSIYDIDKLDFNQPLYFTEGMMDCLSLKSRGYMNSSCSFGSKLKKNQTQILNKFKTIFLIPDNDIKREGKVKGGDEFVNIFYTSVKMPEIFVVHLPLAIDVDQCDDALLDSCLKDIKHLADYIVDRDLKINKPHSIFDLKNSSRLKVK